MEFSIGTNLSMVECTMNAGGVSELTDKCVDILSSIWFEGKGSCPKTAETTL